MKVRFLPLQMKYNIINLLIIVSIFLIIFEYKEDKKNLGYIFLSIFIIFLIFEYNNILFTNLFNLEVWKLTFLFLIFGIYFVILDLIEEDSFDIYCLVSLVFIGSILLVTCDSLITLYLGLELQTFSIFILIAKNRLSIKSSEAGLKYFILGALSSGFYLLGTTILFSFGYSLDIKDLVLLTNNYISSLSLILITMSFCFKLSLFPLHFWIPDIYEGSSWDIIALISSLPKISVISILIQLIINSHFLLIFSILSIIIGTFGALNQSKIKRLLGYSGISHIGFIMLGFSLLVKEGFIISNLYLIVYMLIMLAIFILIINANYNSKFIIELGGLKFINRIFAISFILLTLSLAGIPPLSGFISKWFLLLTSIEFHYNISAFIIILFSAIGAGYYLRIVKIIYFQRKSSYLVWENILSNNKKNKELNLVLLGFLFFLSLFLIFNFSFIIDFINLSTINIF